MNWASAVRKQIKAAAPKKVAAEPAVATAPVDWDRLVSLDFETYYDADYTLKKLSTSEYIRDERFEAQMVAIKIGKAKTMLVPMPRIQAVLNNINWATHSVLAHNVAFDGFILSHHFGVIPLKYYCTLSMARGLHSNEVGGGLNDVAQFYGGKGKIEGALDDMKGVRFKEMFKDKPLWKRSGEYCVNDVNEMYRIFVEMHKIMPPAEMELIHMTARMFCAPVLRVNIPRVEAEYKREVDRREKLLLSLLDPREYDHILDGKDRKLEGVDRDRRIVSKVLGSNPRFVELLLATGMQEHDIPQKISPAWMKKSKEEQLITNKWSYAFAKDDLEFTGLPDNVFDLFTDLDRENPGHVLIAAAKSTQLQHLVDARIAVKSTTNITRAERFLKAGADGMPLPVGYAYYRAHTGRWGGNNKMNMQNLQRGGELRLAIEAAPGHAISVVDSGQIEARVNGWLWEQDDLLDSFRASDSWDKAMGVARGKDRDAYCKFGDQVYGREITTLDKMERFVGKVCVLGLGYQMGAPKFQLTLAKGALGGPPVNFPIDQCHHIVGAYRRINYKIAEGWKTCARIIEEMADGIEGQHKCLYWGGDGAGGGYIRLPNGMSLKYPQLRKSVGEKGWDEWSYQSGPIRKKIYGGLLCENLVQALARIIVAEQMLMIDAKYPIVMTTHDEAVAHPKLAQADKCYDYMYKCMTTPLWWCQDIPLAAEGGWATNYSK